MAEKKTERKWSLNLIMYSLREDVFESQLVHSLGGWLSLGFDMFFYQ